MLSEIARKAKRSSRCSRSIPTRFSDPEKIRESLTIRENPWQKVLLPKSALSPLPNNAPEVPPHCQFLNSIVMQSKHPYMKTVFEAQRAASYFPAFPGPPTG